MNYKPNYKEILVGTYIAAQTMLPLTALAQNYQSNSQLESKLEQTINDQEKTPNKKEENNSNTLNWVLGSLAVSCLGLMWIKTEKDMTKLNKETLKKYNNYKTNENKPRGIRKLPKFIHYN